MALTKKQRKLLKKQQNAQKSAEKHQQKLTLNQMQQQQAARMAEMRKPFVIRLEALNERIKAIGGNPIEILETGFTRKGWHESILYSENCIEWKLRCLEDGITTEEQQYEERCALKQTQQAYVLPADLKKAIFSRIKKQVFRDPTDSKPKIIRIERMESSKVENADGDLVTDFQNIVEYFIYDIKVEEMAIPAVESYIDTAWEKVQQYYGNRYTGKSKRKWEVVQDYEREAFIQKWHAKRNRRRGRAGRIDNLIISRRYAGEGSNDAWIINPDGTFVEPSEVWGKQQRWYQPTPECLVLQWAKGHQHAEHEFDVLQMPKGKKLTDQQILAVQKIQEEIAKLWEGRCPGNHVSPSMGDGWGIVPRTYELVTA